MAILVVWQIRAAREAGRSQEMEFHTIEQKGVFEYLTVCVVHAAPGHANAAFTLLS